MILTTRRKTWTQEELFITFLMAYGSAKNLFRWRGGDQRGLFQLRRLCSVFSAKHPLSFFPSSSLSFPFSSSLRCRSPTLPSNLYPTTCQESLQEPTLSLSLDPGQSHLLKTTSSTTLPLAEDMTEGEEEEQGERRGEEMYHQDLGE